VSSRFATVTQLGSMSLPVSITGGTFSTVEGSVGKHSASPTGGLSHWISSERDSPKRVWALRERCCTCGGEVDGVVEVAVVGGPVREAIVCCSVAEAAFEEVAVGEMGHEDDTADEREECADDNDDDDDDDGDGDGEERGERPSGQFSQPFQECSALTTRSAAVESASGATALRHTAVSESKSSPVSESSSASKSSSPSQPLVESQSALMLPCVVTEPASASNGLSAHAQLRSHSSAVSGRRFGGVLCVLACEEPDEVGCTLGACVARRRPDSLARLYCEVGSGGSMVSEVRADAVAGRMGSASRRW
jgi:hypothetical protein